MPRIVAFCIIFMLPSVALSASKETEVTKGHNSKLEKSLYSPFVERYFLVELKQLRSDMASQKHELIQQVVDRKLYTD